MAIGAYIFFRDCMTLKWMFYHKYGIHASGLVTISNSGGCFYVCTLLYFKNKC